MDLSLPAWYGSYKIVDHSKHVVQFKAVDGAGRELAWRKVDKNTWRVSLGGARAITARYTVYGRETGTTRSWVTAKYGHILGASILLFIDDRPDLPATVMFSLPEGWKVSCGAFPDPDVPTLFRFDS